MIDWNYVREEAIKANQFYLTNKLKKSINCYDKLIEKYPFLWELYNNRANLYYSKYKKYAYAGWVASEFSENQIQLLLPAINDYIKAIEINKNNIPALINLGIIYRLIFGHYGNGELNKKLSIPNFEKLPIIEDIETYFDRVLEIDEKNLFALYNRAIDNIKIRKRKSTKRPITIEDINKDLEKLSSELVSFWQPFWGNYKYLQGMVAEEIGDIENAMNCYAEAASTEVTIEATGNNSYKMADVDFCLENIVIDIETKLSHLDVGGWFPEKMGFGIAVTYDDKHYYRTWTEDRIPHLIKELLLAKKVIGFNNLNFDYKVLEPYHPGISVKLKPNTVDIHSDIYAKLNRRVSLNDLAKSMFGEKKSGNGLEAVKLMKEGKLDLVANYCKTDVRLTKKIYEYGLLWNKVFINSTEELVDVIEVDWE